MEAEEGCVKYLTKIVDKKVVCALILGAQLQIMNIHVIWLEKRFLKNTMLANS